MHKELDCTKQKMEDLNSKVETVEQIPIKVLEHVFWSDKKVLAGPLYVHSSAKV